MKRFAVTGSLFVVAGTLAALFCVCELPSACSPVDRVRVWVVFMTGPMYATLSDSPSLAGAELFGWCGLLLGLSHPLRPTPWTGVLAAFGLFLWFSAGFLTVLVWTAV
ncbi:hypothetical protein R5W24_002744 [Gemmata sp. JC717]|uniref:hypothetical protein n=1 Tax=Gemmata algarum TaxID=2975278 RepID=UPI0021BAF23C|nr:hypothetical protein [Gemmata algarum]MDY3553641.1 hypothetical protein [Gemmata algarum]